MKRIEANGIVMSYAEAGPEEAPAVLLIHGLGWDAWRLWSGVLASLAGAGFRVLAPNLRGVGGTEATGEAYSTALYAEDLLAFLDALGLSRVRVVGFSMGASIAGKLLEQAPEKVASLTLACGGLHATEEGMRGVEAMLSRAETLGPDAFAAEQAEAIFRPAWAAAHRGEVEDFKRWRAGMDQSALFRAFRSGRGTDQRATVKTAAADGLPVQVIAADADAFLPLDDLRALASAIPGARLDVISACGHMATIEQPEAFERALLEFLLSQGDGS
jgi:pimeloyl-ACP methyl ester carboxylesterase